MKRRLAFLALVLGFFLLACQLIAGIDRVEKQDTPPPVPDVIEEPRPPPPDPCSRAQPPPPPAVDDAPTVFVGDAAGGDKFGVLYFALRQVNLVGAPGEPPFGYDLDGVCTCDSRRHVAFDGGSSCKLPAGALRSCDDDGGIDNNLVPSVSKFSGLVDIDQAANINNRISKGQQNSIIIITKYNGRANDKEVGVGIFTSEGIIDEAGAGPQPGCPDSGLVDRYWSPGWCGTDRWTVNTKSVITSGEKFEPRLIGVGYVTNYTFVVKFEGDVGVPFAGYRLALGSPIATGRLVPLDANQQPLDPSMVDAGVPYWRLEEGLLAGRVPVSELLAAVGTFTQPGSEAGSGTKHLCSSTFFPLIKSAICPAVDTNQAAKLDFDPGATCDAVSTALKYRADPVVVDGFVVPTVDSNECYPTADGTRPSGAVPGVTYTCP